MSTKQTLKNVQIHLSFFFSISVFSSAVVLLPEKIYVLWEYTIVLYAFQAKEILPPRQIKSTVVSIVCLKKI